MEIIKKTPEGFLENWKDWNKSIAQSLAQEQNLSLSKEHWLVLDFVREFYTQYEYTPIQRFIIKHLRSVIPNSDSVYLKKLFPEGPRQICLIAGLPKPARCV